MSDPSISRVLLFAEDPEAEAITGAIGAATGTNAVWDRFTRSDGTETQGGVLKLPGLTVEVLVGNVRLPALLELTVADLDEAKDRLVRAGFEPKDADMLGGLRLNVGGLNLVVVGPHTQLDHLLRDESPALRGAARAELRKQQAAELADRIVP